MFLELVVYLMKKKNTNKIVISFFLQLRYFRMINLSSTSIVGEDLLYSWSLFFLHAKNLFENQRNNFYTQTFWHILQKAFAHIYIFLYILEECSISVEQFMAHLFSAYSGSPSISSRWK